MPSRKNLKIAQLLLAFGLVLASHSVRASDLDVAQRQWLAGQRPQAVATVEKALALTPNELKLRFALGVMRMELGENEAAQRIFTDLSQDFPDLAEPYNNLAVLFAARGELELAHSNLEQALRLQPGNAQAQENMGDVLLRLAARAYQLARQAQTAPTAALILKLQRTQSLLTQLQGPSPIPSAAGQAAAE